MLNEDNYIKLFTQSNHFPLSNILTIYKILFHLINKEETKEILNSKDDIEFWTKTCDYFLSMNKDEIKFGISLKQNCTPFDFSEDNIHLISKLCYPLIDILTPSHFSEKCPTTSLFLFIIQDALEYVGILQDRRTQPGIMHKYASSSISKDNELLAKLESIKLKII